MKAMKGRPTWLISDRGMVLPGTLMIMAILVTIVTAMGLILRLEVKAQANAFDELKAFYLARGGINLAKARLSEYMGSHLLPGSPPGEIETNELDVSGASIKVSVADENAKININTASKDMLMGLPGVDSAIADAILDWRDTDDEPRAEGAERDYYEALPDPYPCKNGPFDTVGELSLVKGMTVDIMTPDLFSLLTVSSFDMNITGDGRPRVNINKESEEGLVTKLGGRVSVALASAIVRYRENNGPFKTIGEVWMVPGVTREKIKELADLIAVTDAKKVPGLININAASSEVLMTIPGMNDELAEAILARREEEPFQTVGDILDISLIDRDAFVAMSGIITVRTYAYEVTSEARIEDSGIQKQILAIVTGESGLPAVCYWREVD